MGSSILPAAHNYYIPTLPLNLPCKKTTSFSQVKAQSQHEGRRSSRTTEGESLRILRVRIEEARKKERLERCLVADHGWNYGEAQGYKGKTNYNVFVEVVGLVAATFGFTILTSTFCLCIAASIIIHFYQ